MINPFESLLSYDEAEAMLSGQISEQYLIDTAILRLAGEPVLIAGCLPPPNMDGLQADFAGNAGKLGQWLKHRRRFDN